MVAQRGTRQRWWCGAGGRRSLHARAAQVESVEFQTSVECAPTGHVGKPLLHRLRLRNCMPLPQNLSLAVETEAFVFAGDKYATLELLPGEEQVCWLPSDWWPREAQSTPPVFRLSSTGWCRCAPVATRCPA